MPDRSRFITLPQNRAHRFLLCRIQRDRLGRWNLPQTSADKIGGLLVNPLSRECAPPERRSATTKGDRSLEAVADAKIESIIIGFPILLLGICFWREG